MDPIGRRSLLKVLATSPLLALLFPSLRKTTAAVPAAAANEVTAALLDPPTPQRTGPKPLLDPIDQRMVDYLASLLDREMQAGPPYPTLEEEVENGRRALGLDGQLKRFAFDPHVGDDGRLDFTVTIFRDGRSEDRSYSVLRTSGRFVIEKV